MTNVKNLRSPKIAHILYLIKQANDFVLLYTIGKYERFNFLLSLLSSYVMFLQKWDRINVLVCCINKIRL